jgi:hypothetical protein
MVVLNVTGPRNVIATADLTTCVDPVTNETLKFEPVKESQEVGQRPSFKAETSKGRVYFATFDDALHISTFLKDDAEEGVEQSVADFNPRAFRAGEEPKEGRQPTKNLTQQEIDEKIDRDNIDGGPVPPGEFAGRMEQKKKDQEARKSGRKEAKEENALERESQKQERKEEKSTRFASR